MLPLRALTVLICALPLAAQDAFVNWESAHVHPLDATPDGTRLLAVNTADARLEVFDLGPAEPALLRSIPVGIDPVSVRAESNQRAWVVNHIGDSVSVVDLAAGNVIATLLTDDEPCDVVFAGAPRRAFVSCSQANTLLVFDPERLGLAPLRLALNGEEPKALAVDASGMTVHVAFFESGNATTILGGGDLLEGAFPPNVVNEKSTPHGGVNPPPNAGDGFEPPMTEGLPEPPEVGLIIRRDDEGRWMDDSEGDWTKFVSGKRSWWSGRPPGWTILDHDMASIDTTDLSVTYAGGLLNIAMGLAVHPLTGHVQVIGTDATNEVRFEPVLNGKFLRVLMGSFDGDALVESTDLNAHVDYDQSTLPAAQRLLSVGDPRGIAWNAAGSHAYVTGKGSNNLVILDGDLTRAAAQPIRVGEGPTGVVVDEARQRVYVLNHFAASISVIDVAAGTELTRVPFHDATPEAIRRGRRFLFDTQLTSGNGLLSCASCHVDVRYDRLAWDLGNPAGEMKSSEHQNFRLGLQLDWHPMKGPMVTQTLQDIIGKEPFHWRGDRDGLEGFNEAFTGLMGDDVPLTHEELQLLQDYLATVYFPPNPYRRLDNSFPDNVDLSGHYTSMRHGKQGLPLPPGDPTAGMGMFRPPTTLNGHLACASCHTLPTGLGSNTAHKTDPFTELPLSPRGESHRAISGLDGFTNVTMKNVQLRGLYEKIGFDLTQTENLAGFGFLHDGSSDSLSRTLTVPLVEVNNAQETADLLAFMLCFTGSDMPVADGSTPLEPKGKDDSLDTHAAVGKSVTIASANPSAFATARQHLARSLAETGRVGLIVQGLQGGLPRGYAYVGGNVFQSDRRDEQVTFEKLKSAARPGSELTWTIVPAGTQRRLGVDRDQDGIFDRDELDAGSDPADPVSRPDLIEAGAPVKRP